MKEKILDVIRWIGVFPVALITPTLGGKIIETILLIQNSQGNWPVVIESVISPMIYWSLAVYLGAIIAPKKRNVVALALGFIVVGIQFLGMFFYFTIKNLFGMLDLVGFFFVIISVGYIIYKFCKEGGEFSFY